LATRKQYDGPCDLEKAFEVFAGRWKPAIIYHLRSDERLRFGELRRKLPEVSQRILTSNLRQMERDGIIQRDEFMEVPRRVEYSLTELGESLTPIMVQVEEWSRRHMARIERYRETA
jgi:DNA-binding HxlR family transcriptional regulator